MMLLFSMGEVMHFFKKKRMPFWKTLLSKLYISLMKAMSDAVQIFPFEDHQAPPYDLMLEFCKSVDEWLSKDPENVVVVHCKAGKGRSGLLISVYLLHTGSAKSADDALKVGAADEDVLYLKELALLSLR